MFRPLAFTAALVLASASFAAADSAPDVRLGHDAVPTYSHLTLQLDPDKRSYSGTVHVDLRVDHATRTIAFHAEGQRLTAIALRQGADTLACERTSGDHGLVTLTATRDLKPGTATLDLEFTAMYGTRAVGLYKTAREGRNYLFTQFESDDAREAFPCWDEPCFKFPYQVTLRVPAAQQAVSNTPVESEQSADGWRTITYKRTAPLPSYLLAIAVGPFEFVDVPGCSIPTRIVTCVGQSRLASTTAEMTPKILGGLERWFGTKYPFEKLDLIAVPEFAYGAMENAGAITFRDDALLMDPSTATITQRRSVASTTCHELAHMWFGDLVTMNWWDDLWLNESFADWMAAKVTDQVFPDLADGLNDLSRIEGVKSNDMQPSTTPIREKTKSSEAGLTNVGLVYSKGNAVLSMFERYLGPETFQRGVRDYLKAHAGGNATASDLWSALDHASGTNVSSAMATFTDQPGVPFVRLVPIDGGVRLTQVRATPEGVPQAAMRWRVPLVLRYPDGKTVREQRVLLTEASQDVKLAGATKPAWVLPNGGGRGYFAWSVPPAWMEALADQAEQLTPEERMSFVGNLGNLVTTGDVHGDTYLKAMTHFGADPAPTVVSMTIRELNGVRPAWIPDSMSTVFAPYVRQTLEPALARVGYERRAGEDESISTMRGELLTWLARRGEDEKVMAFAITATKRYLADSTSVDPSVVDAVLNLAARSPAHGGIGDAAFYEDIRRRFEAASVPALRRRYLATLGAFDDPALQARTLDYALTDAVRGTEFFQVLLGFGGRDEAAGRALFQWLMDHYDAIAARVPPPALRFMPMMGSGCSEERLAATKAFFTQPSHSFVGVDQTLKRVDDSVHECLSLRERESATVNAYLRSLSAK